VDIFIGATIGDSDLIVNAFYFAMQQQSRGMALVA
jgi:hypothetical protein